ncbi:MAG TPA: hypothetical protein ENI27_08620 [bacterium]|nr:hypothetical protein [bacterium]
MKSGSILIFFLLLPLSLAAESFIIEKADQLFAEDKYEEAHSFLIGNIDNLKGDLEKAKAYWRLSKSMVILGIIITREKASKDEILAVYQQGIDFADKAIELNKNCRDAFLWKASALGSWGQAKGPLDALKMAGKTRDNLGLAIEIDPEYDPAFSILAMVYGMVPGWPLSFGNVDYAVSFARRAVDCFREDEKFSEYYLLLGRFLWKRNWKRNKRLSRLEKKSREFDRHDIALEKFRFYEGKIDFNKPLPYGETHLADMSDRDEARAILDSVEKKVKDYPLEEKKSILEHVSQLRKKWK